MSDVKRRRFLFGVLSTPFTLFAPRVAQLLPRAVPAVGGVKRLLELKLWEMQHITFRLVGGKAQAVPIPKKIFEAAEKLSRAKR